MKQSYICRYSDNQSLCARTSVELDGDESEAEERQGSRLIESLKAEVKDEQDLMLPLWGGYTLQCCCNVHQLLAE